MSYRSPDDVMLPPQGRAETADKLPVAAFVPIVVALMGVAAILFGGLVARQSPTIIGKAGIDPVVTGSVVQAPADVRRSLEMLDR